VNGRTGQISLIQLKQFAGARIRATRWLENALDNGHMPSY